MLSTFLPNFLKSRPGTPSRRSPTRSPAPSIHPRPPFIAPQISRAVPQDGLSYLPECDCVHFPDLCCLSLLSG